jgi:hypothetical protein
MCIKISLLPLLTAVMIPTFHRSTATLFGEQFMKYRLVSLAMLGLAFSTASTVLAAKGSASRSEQKSSAAAKAMAPEFGPSVVFDRTDGATQLSDLRGKMAVLVFFQSW